MDESKENMPNGSDNLLGEDFWQEIRELIPNSGPRVDIYHTPDAVVVLVEIPGLDKPEKINIRLDGDLLIIDGELPCLYPVTNDRISRKERFFGKFRRAITLPMSVSKEGISTSCNNGLLVVELSINSTTQQKNISAKYGPWKSKSVRISGR